MIKREEGAERISWHNIDSEVLLMDEKKYTWIKV